MLLEDVIETNPEPSFPFRQPVPGCIHNIGTAWGHIIVPIGHDDMQRFYEDLQRYTYDILRQLNDNIGRRLKVELFTSCDFMNIPEPGFDPVIYPKPTRTSAIINASNEIQNVVEYLRDNVNNQLLIPQNVSGLTFHRAVYFKISYLVDESKDYKAGKKKNHGGEYFTELYIPVFRKPLRKRDIEKYQNKNKTEFI